MNNNFDFSGRLANLLDKLKSEEVDAILITKGANVTYFSGFRGGSTVLLVGKNFRRLITDGRYIEQAIRQAKNFTLVEHVDGLYKKIVDEIKFLRCKKVGFEGLTMTFAEHAYLQKELAGVEFKSIEVDTLRQVKDAAEIAHIRKACQIADDAFAKILDVIKPNVRELDVAAELEYFMRKSGSEKIAFTTIVASGWRSSLPHGEASDKKIQSGDFVTLDFGATFGGYRSDITRTVCVGRASTEQKIFYDAVLDAQLYGLKVIAIGKSGKDIDAAVRERLKSSGFDKYRTEQGDKDYFVHGLGHGVGLEIHEEPRLSKLSKCEQLLPNMVVTDEPGIYLGNFGGVRIEDTVLVTSDGAQPLTHSPKHLIEL